MSLAEVGRNDEAVEHYDNVIRRLPHWAEAHVGLGYALQGLGRHTEAISAFSTALHYAPRHARAYYYLGESYAACEEFQAALMAFRRVVNLEPHNANALSNVGTTLGRLGHWHEALECDRKAFALKPSLAFARNIGVTLTELGRLREAEEAFHEALKFEPTSSDVKTRLALVLAKLGRSTQALQILETVTAERLPDGVALSALSDVLRIAEKHEEALRVAKRATRLHPRLPQAWAALGWAYLKSDEPAMALEAFEHGQQLTPDDIDFLAWRGAALSALGRHREAMTIFRQVAAVDADYFRRNEAVAEFLSRSRKVG